MDSPPPAYSNGGALEARVAALEKAKPPLATIFAGVGLLFAVGMWISDKVTTQNAERIGRLETTAVTQAVFDRVDADVAALRAGQVPRGEIDERWRSIEADIARLGEFAQENRSMLASKDQLADLQRQIDRNEDQFGDTYSLRDQILSMQEELDRLRMKVLEQP